ncbi:hypothetical protein BDN70DRAFT_766353, partial [Pholiota conissans]
MLDCGAFSAYIHEDYVLCHNLETTPLPHPIPVYNADGSMNRSGSIKSTIKLTMKIKDHLEILTFTVTNIG